MLILGFVWVTSWIGTFSALSGKLAETPRYFTNVLSGTPTSINPANSLLATSSRFNPVAGDPENRSTAPLMDAVAKKVLFNKLRPWLITSRDSENTTATNAQFVSEQESETSLTNFFEIVEGNLFELASRTTKWFAPNIAIVEASYESSLRDSKQENQTERSQQCTPKNPSESRTLGGFQIWVKGCFVAELPDRELAEKVANSFQNLLESADLAPDKLQPVLLNGKPTGQLGNRVLFSIDQTLANQLGQPAEILAIVWINNLRIALGDVPLALADAQVQLHNLQATGGSINGMASWYGPYFHGRQTATGEIFDQNELTAAHPTLPFDTFLKVTNLLNGESVVVRVNDRGPYFDNRVLDLSNRAAQEINSDHRGVVPIEAKIMHPVPQVANRTPTRTAGKSQKISMATGN
jgi:rare lipoprotein A